MTTRFDPGDCPEITDLWNAHFPTRHQVDPGVLQCNVFTCPTFQPNGSFVCRSPSGRLLGAIALKSSPDKLYVAPSGRWHISLLVALKGTAADHLVESALEFAYRQGAKEAVFGSDSGHVWPGCPEKASWLESALWRAGFRPTGQPYCDVSRDLRGYKPKGKTSTRQAGPNDRPHIEEFLAAEFPGRWKHDVLRCLDLGDHWSLELATEGQRVLGFAMVQDRQSGCPRAGAVWRSALGEGWCALGPIGVAKDSRGSGLGDALLSGALSRLKQRGGRTCVIDWTVLVDFYARHGFAPRSTYRAWRTTL